MGKRNFRVVDFPMKDAEGIKVAIRCLTESESYACQVESHQQLRAMCVRRGWDIKDAIGADPSLSDRLVERQLVWRATFDPESIEKDEPEHFFPSYDDMEDIDPITIERLLELIDEHQQWVNPKREVSKEQLREMVDALGKPDGAVALERYERSTLLNLCIALASDLRSMTSQTGKSSSGQSSTSPT